MKCPKCGCELVEGHLYCDNCGEEIRIVPDFEPEIEYEMSETLSTLVVELSKEAAPQTSDDSEKEKRDGSDRKEEKESAKGKNEKKKNWRVAGVAVGFVFVAVLCVAGNILYRNYSVSWQIKSAKECAEQKKYTQAIVYLERANELDKENTEILFLMADYYYIQGKYDLAVFSMQRIIEAPDSYQEGDVERAYDKTISIYKEQNDYQSINELLLACHDESIVTMFQQYIAKPPEFSYVEGNYDEVLPLKLSANTSGKIYYTLDGSIPDENSEMYTAPIFLETGTYTVTAFFVNDYGIKSSMASSTYQIDLMVPSAPEVSMYSGDYSEPGVIEAQASEECNIYYTTDSTDPTTDSILYTAPIPMPLGKSVYKFIAVSSEGVSSDITIRTYKLTLDTELSPEEAAMHVIYGLMEEDVLLDEQGSLRAVSGHNVYTLSAVIRVEGSGDYYIFNEYYEDATGIQTKTDRIYGVNVNDGSACRVGYEADGTVLLTPLGEPN